MTTQMCALCDVSMLIGRYAAVADASRAKMFSCSTCTRLARNLEVTQ